MIKIRKKALVIIAALWSCAAGAQTLTPVLVGSAGGFSTVGNISISSSAGEGAVQTLGPTNGLFLTQGFQQPSSAGIMPLTVTFGSSNSTCIGANNGLGYANVVTGNPPYNYQWSSGDNTDTTGLLPPGTYVVTVTDAKGFAVVDSVVVGEENTNCGIVVYSGLTPNGDNHNDQWNIDFIELYPENSVAIFNRWGQRVWYAEHYNNQDIVWKGTNEKGEPLPDGTYYYVIKVDGKTLTKWVELTH